MISKELVTLKQDVKLPIPLSELGFIPLNSEKLIKFLDEMEFNKIKLNVISKFGKGLDPENEKKNNKEKNLKSSDELLIPIRQKLIMVNTNLYLIC